ncbi:phosphate ABC transporter substrate-binding protein [Pseudohongiella acticola]|jgi:ABC-type phosphate transport system substrate-binding protein|uniref:Phosphate ABC transporter substrate-binding protein n=1 Tax=Pseudohongiella acticola TaxID=1524254 RepID=A0A1E8CFH3_9GAMM|nr:phosphate ABC transporter substrate-binding protein [Pseudohongiella acticola]OFE11105.1 phosphate ABC transporter substrate-binding protein [Pseudohongiella acticola]
MLNKILVLLCLTMAWPAYADIAVIVHPSSSAEIDVDELNRLYTGRSSALTAVNLQEGLAMRSEFDEKGAGRASAQLKAHWSKLVFTGKGTPPAEVANEAAMLSHVASNPDAIGYVDAGSVDDSVKVILTLQ